MRRKRKIKKNVKIIMFLIIIVIALLVPYFSINISLIGSKTITLDYGEKYSEPGYKGTFFNKKITKDISIKNSIKKDLGSYKVTYTYNWLFYKKNVIRKVKVKDISPPDIILKGDNSISLFKGEKYIEPGYKAIDNLDKDITKKVKVTNNINSNINGKYKVEYSVKDSNGNKRKVIRNIVVDKKNPKQMSLEEYSLKGYFENVQLKETTENNEYFKKIVFIGDSNIKNMFLTGFVPGNQAWYLPCITSESYFREKLYIAGREQILLLDAIEKYKPEIIVLSLGTFSTNWITTEVFLDKSNELLNKIKEKSPNTKVILSSLYPIRKGKNINDFSQSVINTYNYYILEMANKHKLKFLDVQEALKAKDGYANDAYFLDDKFHFTDAGRSVYLKYVKTHRWES